LPITSFWWDMRVPSERGGAESGRTVAVAICLLFGILGFNEEGAAQIALRDTHGNTQDVSRYKGKVVVLNFWATWCVPCQHEMPLLGEMQKKYEDRGVVVLGASVDDERSQPLIQPFAEKNKIPFPLLLGATTDQMQQLQLGEAIPATAFFDADGNLVARVLGELNKSDLQNRLEWMLGKHHGKAPPAFVNGFQKKPASDTTPSIFSH
jgi:thiol-disulfide isomerase/thioredoxin